MSRLRRLLDDFLAEALAAYEAARREADKARIARAVNYVKAAKEALR